eukprot:7180022-Alexandrium_andersonii.AAC.1
MSASLVGSEMCIRDRAREPRARSRWATPLLGRIRTRARAVDAPPMGSVSYTHLTLPTICSV